MKKYSSVIIAILVLVLAAGTAQALDLYWGSGSTQGGSGPWDTSNPRWGSSVSGPFSTTWVNSSDTAIFGGTAGTVTLGENIQVGGLRFDSGYTISGAYTLTFAAASSITNNAGNVTFSGGVSVTNFSGTAYIGYNNGNSGKSVTIENGGKWYGGNVYVGYASGASANNNRYNVGGSGAASIVSNGAIFVGGPQSGDGSASQNYNTMVVSNATLQMSGQLSIGFGGNTMNNNVVIVDNQGTVQMGNNSIVICASSYTWAHWNNNGLVITNGGYLSAGALTVNMGDANNYVLVANGGTLVTSVGTINGVGMIIGGGSTGPTSTWNLTSTNLIISGSGNTGTLTVDGNGLAGGAVVTNVNPLLVGNPGSGSGIMLMTNGAQVFVTSVMLGKGTSTSHNNKLTIAGGAGVTSVLNAGGGSVTVGYLPVNSGADNNQLIINAGGILTNAGPMLVANAPSRSYNGICNNLLVVTNGGQLFTTGNSFISQDLGAGSLGNLTNNTAVVAGTNSANGVRSLWNLGGGNLTVGYSVSSGIPSFNNSLTVSAGGILTNAGLITIGAVSARSYQNSMTVSNASISSIGLMIGNTSSSNTVTVSGNSTWNLGGSAITVGSGSVTSNGLTISGSMMTNASSMTVTNGSQLTLYGGAGVLATTGDITLKSGSKLAVYISEKQESQSSRLAAGGTLTISGVTLNLSLPTLTPPSVPAYIIASCGSPLTTTFAATNGMLPTWKLDYNYKLQNQIALIPPPPAGTVLTLR